MLRTFHQPGAKCNFNKADLACRAARRPWPPHGRAASWVGRHLPAGVDGCHRSERLGGLIHHEIKT